MVISTPRFIDQPIWVYSFTFKLALAKSTMLLYSLLHEKEYESKKEEKKKCKAGDYRDQFRTINHTSVSIGKVVWVCYKCQLIKSTNSYLVGLYFLHLHCCNWFNFSHVYFLIKIKIKTGNNKYHKNQSMHAFLLSIQLCQNLISQQESVLIYLVADNKLIN